MKELTIEPKSEGKGRSFSATLVAYVRADLLFSAALGADATRPIFIALAGTDQELRPFVANLRTGRKAEHGYKGREKYEVLKSAAFQTSWHRTLKGTLVSLFAPDLFALDPGMVDPKGISFCILPSKAWLKPSSVEVPDCVPEDRVDIVRGLAPLFIAYLDRRTRCPLIPDPRFYVQVLANALDQGLATFARDDANYWKQGWGEHDSRFVEYGTEALGMAPGIAFRCSHEDLEVFLAEQVKNFFGTKEEEKAA